MRELTLLKTEAEKWNNPEEYSKYGKAQREIIKKEKIIRLMQ